MRKLLALLAVCTAVVACDTRRGSLVTAPFSAELGTYALQSVSGAPLPFALPRVSPGTTQQLLTDTLVLTSGGNVRDVRHVSTLTPPAPALEGSATLTGRYTITRDSIGLPPGFPYVFGRYASGTITFTDAQGFVYVFTRP